MKQTHTKEHRLIFRNPESPEGMQNPEQGNESKEQSKAIDSMRTLGRKDYQELTRMYNELQRNPQFQAQAKEIYAKFSTAAKEITARQKAGKLDDASWILSAYLVTKVSLTEMKALSSKSIGIDPEKTPHPARLQKYSVALDVWNSTQALYDRNMDSQRDAAVLAKGKSQSAQEILQFLSGSISSGIDDSDYFYQELRNKGVTLNREAGKANERIRIRGIQTLMEQDIFRSEQDIANTLTSYEQALEYTTIGVLKDHSALFTMKPELLSALQSQAQTMQTQLQRLGGNTTQTQERVRSFSQAVDFAKRLQNP